MLPLALQVTGLLPENCTARNTRYTMQRVPVTVNKWRHAFSLEKWAGGNFLHTLNFIQHTNGFEYGLQIYHLREEYTKKQTGDYHAGKCKSSYNIAPRDSMGTKAVHTRFDWIGSMSLKFAVCPHYINTWVHVDEICKITAHSKRHGVHAKRQYTPWLLRCGVCVNKASDRLSPDLPTGHLRSQAISCWPWTGEELPCICTHALT